MRATISKRICIVLPLVTIGFLVCVSRRAEETWAEAQNSQTPRTAAQVFKNIQVIKDMPASQLQGTMSFMAASLGVDCSHCHTPPAMDKDDKPAKQTARRMLVMMNEINKNFDGKTVVNCATCHQGHTRPTAAPPLPSLAAPIISTAAAGPLPTVDQILERYVKALGGEQALSKIKTRKRVGAVEVAGVQGTFELYEAAPNKQLLTGTLPPPFGSVTQAVDGDTGWVKNQSGLFDMSGGGLAQAKLEANFYLDTRLKEQFKSMTVAGRLREGNREFYVIDASRPDGTTEKLFFDVQSGFLVRRSSETRTFFGALPNATDFDNYKKVGTIWLPFAVRRLRSGTMFVQNISEYKLNVTMDDAIFKKPLGRSPR
jgi:photosynthetic reaction center cytochrome c subunit